MISYVKLATEAGDQYLATLAETQESFLKSISAFAASAPSVPAPTFAVPTPKEVTEASFAFAQKLLKQQKDFADKLLATSESASS